MSRNLTSARPMSTRPPSALAGGTASRLTSAMHQTSVTSSQRIGTAIGFADNVRKLRTSATTRYYRISGYDFDMNIHKY